VQNLRLRWKNLSQSTVKSLRVHSTRRNIVEDFIMQLLLLYTHSLFIKRRFSRLCGLA
jgi:hypothetical protein